MLHRPCRWGGSKCTFPLLQGWLEDSAEALKSLDPNHLVTYDSEGFLGSSTPGAQGPAANSTAAAKALKHRPHSATSSCALDSIPLVSMLAVAGC